jgi:hypothetical protein
MFITKYIYIYIFQIIRIQSPEHGTKRVETKHSESVADFLNKVCLIYL